MGGYHVMNLAEFYKNLRAWIFYIAGVPSIQYEKK